MLKGKRKTKNSALFSWNRTLPIIILYALLPCVPNVGGFPIRNDCVENYVNTLDNGKLHEYLDTIIDGRETGVQVPYSTYYNSVDQRINQRMSSWITGEMTAREFVDYMDEVMRQGINGEL